MRRSFADPKMRRRWVEGWPADRWLKAAIGVQLGTLVYLQVVEWIDLFPWNHVAGGNRQEVLDVVLLGVQVVVVGAFVRGVASLAWAGLGFYAIWLYLQLDTWWKPYLFGSRAVGPNWWFAKTYKFLPSIGDRPVPDANHVVLQLLILAVLFTGALALWRRARPA